MSEALAVEVVTAPIKLDLGCGKNKKGPDWIGVDVIKFDGVDTVLDLAETGDTSPFPFKPWPWENDSVDEVHSSHFLEHLDAIQRIHFFNELWRVLRKDAKAVIITPHWSSGRAYGDLSHKWPPVVEFFWYYLDKKWRADNAPHIALTCDFACGWGYSLAHPWGLKHQDVQVFGWTHYREVAQDMITTCTARK